MCRISIGLSLLCLSGGFGLADEPRLATGEHSLTASFGDEHSDWDFFHDVTVQSEAATLTLIVLEDLSRNDESTGAGDETVEKPRAGGLGDPSVVGTARWPVRPSGQKPWLSKDRKLHGTVDKDGVIQFGVTAMRNDDLVSLHFIGQSSFIGASGKVFLLSPNATTLAGTWKLSNPFNNGRRNPGVNGKIPFGR